MNFRARSARYSVEFKKSRNERAAALNRAPENNGRITFDDGDERRCLAERRVRERRVRAERRAHLGPIGKVTEIVGPLCLLADAVQRAGVGWRQFDGLASELRLEVPRVSVVDDLRLERGRDL